MTKIKDLSIIILIVFIIASILYGIHMFRYEYIDKLDEAGVVIRIDRITNDVCYSIVNLENYKLGTEMNYASPEETTNKIFICYLKEMELRAQKNLEDLFRKD